MWVGVLMVIGLFVFGFLVNALEGWLDKINQKLNLKYHVEGSTGYSHMYEPWERDLSARMYEEHIISEQLNKKSIGELELEAAKNLIAYKNAMRSVDKDAYNKIFGGK